MASRSVTEIFILMRNNAIQSRNFYTEQVGYYISTTKEHLLIKNKWNNSFQIMPH